MRLIRLEDNGKFSLVEYVGDRIPQYAILSHTWGEDYEEVSFKDLMEGTGKKRAGYDKLTFCGKQATKDGLQFFWIDTCCIDKSSSSELTEAINSMFRWYQNSERCYVYLSDVSVSTTVGDRELKLAFEKSRWFTRGWTLQELIAPKSVEFFSKEETRLGDKQSLELVLHHVTGIAVQALRGRHPSRFTVGERMSWVKGRQTKREEDMAYSLLGIFDIYMPLIYGEGRQNAMNRLQKEVRENSKDHSPGLPPIGPTLQPGQKREPSSTVPFNEDPNFVGRPSILAWIRKKCAVPGSRAALVGLGGVGKSQLAIQFCHDIRAASHQTWVFWVHVGTRARFEDGYRRIAEAVKMEGWDNPRADVLRLVRSWLCDESNGRWVMVIDNADDSDVLFPPLHETQAIGTSKPGQASEPLSDFLPQSPSGSILVTSRNRLVAYKLTGSNACIMEVQPMDENDALSLLRTKLNSIANMSDAVKLLQALDYMPLAITQAAAYIEQRVPRMTISRYLNEVLGSDFDRTRLLNQDVGDSRRDGRSSNSILQTWQISFEYIRKHMPTAARLLSLMSLFDRQGIPESLLRNRYQKGDIEADFEEDIHTLTSYSLVRINGDGSEFEMHRLVQFSTKKWLELNNELEEWKEIYLIIIDESFPNGNYENWTTCQKLFPHAEMVLQYQPMRHVYFEHWGSILYKAAWYAAKKGEHKKAEEMDRRTLKERELVLGKWHPDTLNSVDNLARVLRKQRKLKESEELSRRVLEGREKVFGSEHRQTLSSLSCLGAVLLLQDKYEEAESICRQNLIRTEKVLGPEHPETLTRMSNLGDSLSCLGRYEEAETILRRALAGRERISGPDHPETLRSKSIVSTVCWRQGRLKEAEVLDVQVMETRKKVLGDEHPDTLTSLNYLARTLKDQGRNQEALSLMQTCYQAQVRVLGSSHPDTEDTLQFINEWQGANIG